MTRKQAELHACIHAVRSFDIPQASAELHSAERALHKAEQRHRDAHIVLGTAYAQLRQYEEELAACARGPARTRC
jgi:hypothetical protein